MYFFDAKSLSRMSFKKQSPVAASPSGFEQLYIITPFQRASASFAPSPTV
jgi:hypothetical protein